MSNVKRIKLNTIDSTNSYLKAIVLEETRNGKTQLESPIVVTAESQTAGRGRYGKSFFSPEGCGIYLSYAYEKEYSEVELLKVTTRVAELLLPIMQAHSNDELFIKPINDIYRGEPGLSTSRKLAGILTERIDYPNASGAYFIIVGIGINCFESAELALPEELRSIVGYLEPDCSREELIEEIIEKLSQL